MIRIDLSDLMNIGNELEDYATEELEDTMTDIFVDLTSSPPLGVPVDTGVARNSLQLDLPNLEIYSTNPYIGRLNDGSSKQSPAGFIEAAIDRNTRK